MRKSVVRRNSKVIALIVAVIVAGLGRYVPLSAFLGQVPVAGQAAAVESQADFQQAPSSLADIDIPAYTGEPSVSLGDSSGLNPADAPEGVDLPDLDELGRAGVVSATVTPSTMPAGGEERGSIGMIKPTGWHTVRDDSIDGKYLYNHCHLVAWCLSGLNAEERNLVTGTRYMNVEGMLPYEELVASYVECTGGSVFYRVTPDFRGDELVARGVRIQALSLGDAGAAIDLDVYCHNVQPGYSIDYATGEARRS